MAITIPQPQTMVSAETFGQPVATEVNRLSPLVDTLQIFAAVLFVANATLSPNVEFAVSLTGVSSNQMTISTANIRVLVAGRYLIVGSALLSAANTGSYTALNVKVNGTTRLGFVGAPTIWSNIPASGIMQLLANDLITFTLNTDASAARTDNRMGIVLNWLAP